MSVLDRKTQENVTPNDHGAEQAVLGAVLLDHSCLPEIRSLITDEKQFYHPAHAVIFQAICTLSDRGQPVDLVTLKAQLQSMERLNTVGGLQYLGELTDTTPSIANVRAHAAIVRQRADERAVIACASEVIARLRKPPQGGTKDTALDDARGMLNQALGYTMDARKKGPQSFASLAANYVEGVEVLMHGGRLPGVGTGIHEMDELTAGWRGGQLIVCGARPMMGKTAYAMLAAMTAEKDGAVLFISQEMLALELFGREAGKRARLDSCRLGLGRINQSELEDLYAACEALSKTRIEIDDTPGMTLLDIATSAARVRAKHGSLSLIIVDYLQLLSADSSAGTREQEIAQISKGLKRLAKELDVPILALSQLNRSLEQREDKRPKMSDLRESGAIEQDADVIFFLYRDAVYHPESASADEAEFIFAKQRGRTTATIKARWVGKLMQFESLDADRESRGELFDGVEQ